MALTFMSSCIRANVSTLRNIHYSGKRCQDCKSAFCITSLENLHKKDCVPPATLHVFDFARQVCHMHRVRPADFVTRSQLPKCIPAPRVCFPILCERSTVPRSTADLQNDNHTAMQRPRHPCNSAANLHLYSSGSMINRTFMTWASASICDSTSLGVLQPG